MKFEEFKANVNIIKNMFNRSDIIDIDGGTMIIYSENINKYLEKYSCKNAEDLEDTMWFSYGVFVKIVE